MTRADIVAAERGIALVWVAPLVPALRVRLWLALGDLAGSGRWAQGLDDRVADTSPPDVTREAEQIAFARARLAPDRAAGALGVLTASGRSPRSRRPERWRSSRSDGRARRCALCRAVILAAAGGFVRMSLDEAPHIVPLLEVVG